MPDAYLQTVPCPIGTSSADACMRVPGTSTGFAAPKATLSGYLWLVPRDPYAGDALPLSPTGARLRPFTGGVDVASYVAQVYNEVGSGGAVASGAGTDQMTMVEVGSGGAVAGGSGVDTLTSPSAGGAPWYQMTQRRRLRLRGILS